MHTVEITLEQVLLARDRRVLRQRELAARYGGTLLSFTMNIAGPVKDAPLVRLAFQAGLAALDRDLGQPVHRELIQAPTGPEALLVYDRPAPWVKEGLDVRIDHRSYERQGVDLLPTIHEGATVRAMEKKGIRTEKGEFNRWIKATNAVIKDIRKKISLLFDWITEIKAELAKPQTPDLVSLLNDYYTQRKAGAYSQKGKISNLKEMNETYNYLRANGIYTLEDLESRLQSHRTTVDGLKTTMDSQNARMKAIRSLNDYSATYKSLKPVYDGLQKIKFEKSRAKYKTEHADELKMFYTVRRKLTEEFPDGKVDMGKLSKEYDTLEQEHETTYAEFKAVRDDLHRLWKVKSCVDTAARFNEHTEEQKLQNRPQTRHKKEELSR